ncbi:hypothetical protein OQA88_12962 [Cercophora sp. LCS_1]
MSPVNHAALASAGIVVASVAVAAAIAIYESPEVRRVADDLRRRIAIALHSLGDNLDPTQERPPRFNRPEDAEGFLQSRGDATDLDADDETRRRQREELMYWNALREERNRQRASQEQQQSPTRALTFDDFLHEDTSAPDRGTFVFNTGATPSPWTDSQNVLRRRGDGVRGLNASVIANPFADEYGIELDEHPASSSQENEQHALSPGCDEIMSDIFEATPLQTHATLSPQSKPVVPEVLFDFDSHTRSETLDTATVADSEVPEANNGSTMDRELGVDEFMTAGQERDSEAYASIQAWAEGSTGNMGFYSPLPETPVAPVSEPELISEGALTPAYSASVVDVADEVESRAGRDYDVLSEDSDDGMVTPASWSEVGSVVSENDSERAVRTRV